MAMDSGKGVGLTGGGGGTGEEVGKVMDGRCIISMGVLLLLLLVSVIVKGGGCGRGKWLRKWGIKGRVV